MGLGATRAREVGSYDRSRRTANTRVYGTALTYLRPLRQPSAAVGGARISETVVRHLGRVHVGGVLERSLPMQRRAWAPAVASESNSRLFARPQKSMEPFRGPRGRRGMSSWWSRPRWPVRWPVPWWRALVAVGVVVLLLTPSVPSRVGAVRTAVGASPLDGSLPVVPRGAYGWPVGPGRGGGADDAESGPGPPAHAGEDGAVTRAFRAPPNPYGRGHRGVDLAAAPGEAVRAAGAGTVAFVGLVAGRGVVSVDHPGGLRTTYEPVTPSVALGAVVVRGSPLGALDPGHGGCPVAACLHWGLRRPGPGGTVDYLDPLILLGLGHVRLWPLNPRR